MIKAVILKGVRLTTQNEVISSTLANATIEDVDLELEPPCFAGQRLIEADGSKIDGIIFLSKKEALNYLKAATAPLKEQVKKDQERLDAVKKVMEGLSAKSIDDGVA